MSARLAPANSAALRSYPRVLGVAWVLGVLVLSSMGAVTSPSVHLAGASLLSPAVGSSGRSPVALPTPIPLATGTWTAVPDPELGTTLPSTLVGPAPSSASVSVLISLGYTNVPQLQALLNGISPPSSSLYHDYITQAQFDQEFGAPLTPYRSLTQFVESHGAADVQTYADRASLSFDASPSAIAAIFHTTLGTYTGPSGTFVAPQTAPELPASVASDVVEVQGLSTNPAFQAHLAPGGDLRQISLASSGSRVPSSAGYLPPATYQGTQLEYAPDFQVAYDEQSLFSQEGFPTNEVVATILWAGEYTGAPITTPYGHLATDQVLGDYVDSDIANFYNETVPSTEPTSSFHAVPLGGAPGPSRLNSWDSTGAVFENTLDLEMVGSTAPGATIYNVYGSSNSYAQLDTDFAYVLNPTSTPGLDNVSVISNSWYGSDHNDTSWYQDLEQAQARGISVLACSGDSGDNTASSKYFGSEAAFPGTMAYNSFGTTSVGGSDVLLDAGLTIENQTVWNISSKDTGDGGPAGSEGGISAVVAEPSWQLTTEANSVIKGAGRGTPDIAAEANNTLITLSVDGFQYQATNASSTGEFEWAWGTSIATPLTAGILAEIDHVMENHHEGAVGFLNPDLYALANQQDTSPIYNATNGYYADDGYNSSLPVNVTLEVLYGRNLVDLALPGYSLVTGWGTIDAYNFTVMILKDNSSGVPGRLWAVDDDMTLSGLAGTSGTGYLASVQQNFFLADSEGAPIDWVQNVIYIIKSGANYELNYTGWLVYPFYGQYYLQAGYEYSWPLTGHVLTVPLDWNVSTQLFPGTGLDGEWVQFNVGPYSVTLPTPGAAYIIGSLWYNYSWRGQTFENGPFSPNLVPGGLAVETGLVGGPSGGNTSYKAPTKGTISALVMPYGSSNWMKAATGIVWPSITQTGESSYNLAYTQTSQNAWNIGISATSMDQGIVSYEPALVPVTFTETGLAAGSSWYANITGGPALTSSSPSAGTTLAPGTYTYAVAAGPQGYTATPSSGSITVAGAPVVVAIVFTSIDKLVDFTETGLPAGTSWGVTFNGTTSLGATGSLDFRIHSGTWAYLVLPVAGYVRTPFLGALTVGSSPETWLNVTFSIPLYSVVFTQGAAGGPPVWWVNITQGPSLEATGSSVSTTEPNGTFAFTVGSGEATWHAVPTAGTISVASAAASATIAFALSTYAATFEATWATAPNQPGPPALFYVNLTGHAPESAPAQNILSLNEPNGTYTYTVSASNPVWKPLEAEGELTIDGATVATTMEFGPFDYQVTFSQAGLPAGSGWQVTISGSPQTSSNEGPIEVGRVNGSYAYTVTGPAGYTATPDAGTVEVTGSSVSVSVVFTAIPSSSNGGQGGLLGLGNYGYLLMAAIAIAAVVVVLLVLRSRRKKAEGPPPYAAPPAGPTYTPGATPPGGPTPSAWPPPPPP